MKKFSVRQQKKLLRWLILIDAILLIIFQGSLAYFVSTDQVTNTFDAANLDIALFEINYDGFPSDKKANLVPNRLISKDPRVMNTDKTDAFLFLKVTVPVCPVTRISNNGTVVETKERNEIFWLKTDAKQTEQSTSFNTRKNDSDKEYWIELPSVEEGTDYQGSTRTYVFGYNVYMSENELTESLFDYVELKNILQYEVDPQNTVDIEVDAYGIQADYLAGIDKDNGSEKAVMTQEQLTRIYQYIK